MARNMTEWYPKLAIRAFELAAQWHEGQWRKHPHQQIPYIAHPAAVALLLQKVHADEETIAAGILHDVIEDCGVTAEELAGATTPRVAELIGYVSEIKGPPWEERKRLYRQHLESAPIEALQICCADHIHNLFSMIDAAATSEDIWSLFHASQEEKIVHERAVLEIVRARLSSPLVELFAQAVDEVVHLPSSYAAR